VLNNYLRICGACVLVCFVTIGRGYAGQKDEFQVKREEVFEFTEKPSLQKSGDRVEIRFAVKAFCDATIAIEDETGRILRHLASGVLGDNAPEPFQKDSLRQVIFWDGKDDAERYVDNRAQLTVRVSLGLKPMFEKVLFWEPKKRMSESSPIVCASAEGVFIYDGMSVDYVRKFDHQGNYVRTVYPFPADKLPSIDGLTWHQYPQDSARLPVKGNFLQNTMLTSGANALDATYKADGRRFDSVVSGKNGHYGMYVCGATAIATANKRLALASISVNRIGADGGSTGRSFKGPKVSFPAQLRALHEHPGGIHQIGPRSAALSPDGRWLYLSFYFWNQAWNQDGLHGVLKVDMESDAEPTVFAGSFKQNDFGSENGRFCYATAVACDSQGRVYVGDYMNDRIQVFSADGKHLKNIPTPKPVEVAIHHKTGEIYCSSWLLGNYKLVELADDSAKAHKVVHIPARLSRLGSFDDPRLLQTFDLSFEKYDSKVWQYMGVRRDGLQYRVALDSWSDIPTLWMVPGVAYTSEYQGDRQVELWEKGGIRLLQEKDGKLQVIRDFGLEASKSIKRMRPPVYGRQRLYVNPRSGKLYVGEGQAPDGTGCEKAFLELVEIDPDTSEISLRPLPFDAEDMCFDIEGNAYLRGMSHVARFSGVNWKEIPFDYGEELEGVRFSSGSRGKAAKLMGGLSPVQGINWHMGGMSCSPGDGRLAVTCYTKGGIVERKETSTVSQAKDSPPTLYPGRVFGGKLALIHVWDKKGKLLCEDAVPGLPDLYGLEIDRNGNLYVLSSATRHLGGTRYFNDMTGTLMKFKPRNGKVISDEARSVPLEGKPTRPPDMSSAMQGNAWVDGAEWMYGGVGYCGKNRGVGCACWSTRFCLDYFARSFVSEQDRYSVAVIDTNGNLILRLGKYGNEDSRGPGSPVPLGGDEVGLFLGAYMATHSDKRLFIADVGNARIVSVSLKYHTSEKLPLARD
jgi:hypothetical protein